MKSSEAVLPCRAVGVPHHHQRRLLQRESMRNMCIITQPATFASTPPLSAPPSEAATSSNFKPRKRRNLLSSLKKQARWQSLLRRLQGGRSAASKGKVGSVTQQDESNQCIQRVKITEC